MYKFILLEGKDFPSVWEYVITYLSFTFYIVHTGYICDGFVVLALAFPI